MMSVPDQTAIFEAVQKLGNDWHQAGSFPNSVLEEFLQIGRVTPLIRTLETGCGRSTLLFSHISRHHDVFALGTSGGSAEAATDDSYLRVTNSPLFKAETVTFVLGPTQKTLPSHHFEEAFDLILLDRPHAFPF